MTTPEFTDQVAVVTGANRGLGLAISRALAGLGMHVVLTGRDLDAVRQAAAQLTADGLDVSAGLLDVTDPKTITDTISRIVDTYGRVDVLVNNAAIVGDKGQKAYDPDFTRVESILDVNLLGAWRCIAAVAPHMIERGYGRILNISSHLASTTAPGITGGVTYRISKSALGTLTRIVAAELDGTGVLVNAASPGKVNTRMGMGNNLTEPDQATNGLLWLAILPADGPTGGFWHDHNRLPW